MNQEDFWQIIESSRPTLNGNNIEQHYENIISNLSKLSLSEIYEFQNIQDEIGIGWEDDLFSFYYRKFGSQSNDGFMDWFEGFILYGETIFNKIKSNHKYVKSLPHYEYLESCAYICSEAYERKTGRDDFYDVFQTW